MFLIKRHQRQQLIAYRAYYHKDYKPTNTLIYDAYSDFEPPPSNFQADQIDYHDPKYLRNPDQKVVLIISEYRAGSTFISELFNQRDDTIYNFEPLWILEPWNPWVGVSTTENTYSQNIISKILNCELVDPRNSSEFPRPQTGFENQLPWEYSNCLNENICFRDRMKFLNNQPFCNVEKLKENYKFMLLDSKVQRLRYQLEMDEENSEQAQSQSLHNHDYGHGIHDDFINSMYDTSGIDASHQIKVEKHHHLSAIQDTRLLPESEIEKLMDHEIREELALYKPPCDSINLPQYKEFCMSKNILASKILRLKNLQEIDKFVLQNFKKLFSSNITEVNLIFEIRDPRAVLNSRIEIHKNTLDFGFDFCNSNLQSLKYLKTLRLETHSYANNFKLNFYQKVFQRGTKSKIFLNILPVRYEDLALKPIRTANKIYQFLGVDFPDNVRQWIIKNTNDDESRKKCQEAENLYSWMNESNFTSIDDFEDEDAYLANLASNDSQIWTNQEPVELSEDALNSNLMQKCLYSTSRNSKKAVTRWVTKLSDDHLKLIEDNHHCLEIFDHFGYKSILYPENGDDPHENQENFQNENRHSDRHHRYHNTDHGEPLDRNLVNVTDVLDVNFTINF